MSRSVFMRSQKWLGHNMFAILIFCVGTFPVFAQTPTTDKPEKSDKTQKTEKTDKPDKGFVLKVEWSKLAEAKELGANTSLDTVDKETVLKVVRDTSTPQLIALATLKDPKITEKAYQLKGKVRVEGVAGEGFLEMWNHFPEPKPGAAFSRTMAETGPMGKLRGTAPWRDFYLPFMIDDKSMPAPNKLQLNVFLPEKGTVWLSDLTLEEMPLDKLKSQLQGGSTSMPTWFWGAMAGSALAPVLAIAIGFILLKRFRRREHGTELRRMKALDIG